jgi:molybdopterin-guanine dinucleotide biosynthesis protein A
MDTPSFQDIAASDITGLILAGGRGLRMGGADKGLQAFQGKPLVAHVIQRLGPQVGPLLVNANRHIDDYRNWCPTVVADRTAHYDGPLAGMQAGLLAAQTPWLACVPVDSPLIPPDLVRRLASAVCATGARMSVARTASGRHPVFALISTALAPHLADFLASGERRVRHWQDLLGAVEVEFDDELAFHNVNTLEALRQLETDAAGHGTLSLRQ